MSSGEYITLYWPVAAALFVLWELVQLARRKPTMSQYIIRRIAEADERGGFNRWYYGAWAFIVFFLAVLIWLIPHWELL